MTLTELAEKVQTAVQTEPYPERVRVVIPVDLPYQTAGATPIVEVDRTGIGFDWNAGTFRIVPRQRVMPIKYNVPQLVVKSQDSHLCPKCTRILAKKRIDEDVMFCKYCGTAIKWHVHSEDEP